MTLSLSNDRGNALLITLLFVSACATGQRTGTPLPLSGSFSFSGEVRGTHRFQNRTEDFSEAVSGIVVFLPTEVRVSSTHGNCRREPTEVQITGEGFVYIACHRLNLVIGAQSGDVTVPIREIREIRGGCLEYQVDASGRRGSCVRWHWDRITAETMRTGRLTVHPGGPGT